MHQHTRPRYIPYPYQDSATEGRLILRDGSTAQVRLATPQDADALEDFFRSLSAESRYQRFQSVSPPGRRLVEQLTSQNDPREGLTLVVTRLREGQPRIVATGSYQRVQDGVAEIALAVADDLQGLGLGTLLLERLALLAAQHGITRFWALALAENRPMLEVFTSSGFDVRERASGKEVEVDLSLTPTATWLERQGMRERVATVASLRPFFQPRAVVVVGVSRDPKAVGRRIYDGLRAGGFPGPVYAVNPQAPGMYASVRDVPLPVDLAVIAVPACYVIQVIDDCAERGVRAIVIITAGFAEVGGEGIQRQRDLLAKVRGYGMRMIGPNCLGVINAGEGVRLNASFSPILPPPGKIAMSSQSGAVGLAALAVAQRAGLGFSTFVSVGNKADVSGNDLLQYWEVDAQTSVILLYLESFGNPRRFARIARRVGLTKPVVVLHSGLTRSGGRAAGSHTAALASNATAVAALFRQTGVIRAESLEEMFDLARVLASQPLPRGPRVGIITNAGGPAILCTDACDAAGLMVPELSAELQAELRRLLPQAASVGNPMDLIASAGPEQFRMAVEATLRSGEVDALIVIYTPVGLANSQDIADAIQTATASAREAGAHDLPVLACWLSVEETLPHESGLPRLRTESSSTSQTQPRESIPRFAFPEAPARVLGKTVEYARWRNQPPEVYLDFDDIDLSASRKICRQALADHGPGWLSTPEVWQVLKNLGVKLVESELARTPDEAAHAATKRGFPVVLKLNSRSLVHKTDVGGVFLNLSDPGAVQNAYNVLTSRLQATGQGHLMEGVVIQPMVSGGVEMMIGVVQDRLFGPLVAVGLGGIHVEILADVAFRVAPLSQHDADEMIRELRGYRLLEGYRGHPPADIDALQETILRISRLAEEVPEIMEIDLNPVFAGPPGQGCMIVDGRIRVAEPANP